MKQATIRELKNKTSELVRAAGREEVLVTKRGKPVAILKGVSAQELYKHGLELSTPHTQEPEIYVEIHPDAVSFEAPEDVVIEVIYQVSRHLKARSVGVYLQGRGRRSISLEKLKEFLVQAADKLKEEAVVFKFADAGMLYSNGGGCMYLETLASPRVKMAIAENFLKLCGFTVAVKSKAFAAWVRDGQLEVLR
ncbi:MAG: type II toxin-antitoxin system Phd/YefM family antitoxin [Acidobacteriota bacterium]